MPRERNPHLTDRPLIYLGQYWRTYASRGYSTIQCRAYNGYPPEGQYLCTLDPETSFGPVQAWVDGPVFSSVCVRGFWINVWKAHAPNEQHGVWFAHPYPPWEVASWRRRGWWDEVE